MPKIIQLPQDMHAAWGQKTALAPGEYNVTVKRVAQPEAQRIAVLYEVTSPPEFRGATLWDSFNLQFEKGQAMFAEFMDAVGVALMNNAFDAEACEGKNLRVTVRQREKWANVSGHRRV